MQSCAIITSVMLPVDPGSRALAKDGSEGGGTAPVAADLAPLVLVQAAPDTGVLGRHERPLPAFRLDRAGQADGLGTLGLRLDQRGRAHREEELGVLADTTRSVDPLGVGGVVPESPFNHHV